MCLRSCLRGFCYPMPTKRLPYPEYKALTLVVFKRDGWRCRFCKSRNTLHCHHIIYRSQGGEDSLANLMALCYHHHDMVHAHEFVITGDANGKLTVTSPLGSGVRFTI